MSAAQLAIYEDYKDGGTDWIGDIPSGWDLLANKYVFQMKKDTVGKQSANYDLLSLTLRGLIKRDMENPEGKFPAEFDSYQAVLPGDFVFCHFDVEETPRTVGLSRYSGMITGAYTVYEVPVTCNKKFLLYFYLNADTGKKMRGLYKGLRNTISKESFGSFKMPWPPLTTQNAIATFLDEKTANIDEAIAIKERQIALLKERKQIIIQNAVSKGLNPDAPMKDSGVDWVGQIPAHWEVAPLCSQTKIKSVSKRPDHELLSVYLYQGVVRFSDVDEKRTNATSQDLSTYQVVSVGDFVLNNQQAWRGSVGVSKFEGIVSPAYVVLELSGKFDTDFANYYFRSPIMVAHFLIVSRGVGTIQRNLYWPRLKRVPISMPPIEEQRAIVEHINSVSQSIDLAIDLESEQIEKLKEYRTTLINSAVTGKIKVG